MTIDHNSQSNNSELANQLSNDQSNQIIPRPDYSLSKEVSQPDLNQQENNNELANQLSESQTPHESNNQTTDKSEDTNF